MIADRARQLAALAVADHRAEVEQLVDEELGAVAEPRLAEGNGRDAGCLPRRKHPSGYANLAAVKGLGPRNATGGAIGIVS